MTPQKWSIADRALAAIWACPPEQREQALIDHCAGDAEITAEVRSLLAAHQESSAWQAPASEAPPEARRFGPYQLERRLGRGGMGAVYLAHRVDGNLEHKVAIKIIGLPFELPTFQEKFRQERQILASLNHPHITHFIDGGVTPDGELYLIMEYVDGVPIDHFAARLPLAQRLDLFRQVAAAVTYAHQNLIVHRDLKPANILVDSTGSPKLLDFGTAKLLGGEPIEQTSTGLLTIAYASPEQIRGEAASTLSDVYSLGVLLYELASQQKAFAAGLAVRIDTEAERNTLAKLPGDLHLIVHKALAPLPHDRYSSVEQLAEDVLRYQSGKTVLAHPESALYRGGKFIRRNRLAVAAATLGALGILAGTVSTLWQARLAEARYQELRQLANYLVFDIHGGLQGLPGSAPIQKQVVEKATGFLDALARDPQQRLEAAAGYLKLGDVLGNPYSASLGERKRALDTYEKALRALGPIDTIAARRLAAQIRIQQAGTRDFGDKRAEDLQQMSAAIAELRSIADDPSTKITLAASLQLLARRTMDGGAVIESSSSIPTGKLFDEADTLLQSLPQRPPVLLQLAKLEYDRALVWGSSDPNRAIQHHGQAAQWLAKIPEPASSSLELRRLSANNLLNLGWAQGQLQLYPAAIANISKAGDILLAWANLDPTVTSAQYQLTNFYRSRGIVHGYNHDRPAAIADFERAAAIHGQLSLADPANKVYRFLRGELLARIGNLESQSGHPTLALAKASEGLEILTGLANQPNASLSHVFGLCRWLTETEVVSLRNPSAAIGYCQQAIDRTGVGDPDAWEGLSRAREQLGDKPGALAAATKALELIPPAAPGKAVSVQRLNMAATVKRLH